MATKTESEKAGGLTSSLSVELHSLYAIRLWEGRPREEAGSDNDKKRKHSIMSMPQAIKRAGVIYYDSMSDNPYADMAMVRVESLINEASERIHQRVSELEAILKAVPRTVSLTEINSSSPLEIGVFSRSPLGYRCVWLLVGYDEMALKAFQAAHYGLISRNRRDDLLSEGAHLVRRVYGVLRTYRTVKVTRQDLMTNSKAATDAITRFGEVDADIISGKTRSSFSPPLKLKTIHM